MKLSLREATESIREQERESNPLATRYSKHLSRIFIQNWDYAPLAGRATRPALCCTSVLSASRIMKCEVLRCTSGRSGRFASCPPQSAFPLLSSAVVASTSSNVDASSSLSYVNVVNLHLPDMLIATPLWFNFARKLIMETEKRMRPPCTGLCMIATVPRRIWRGWIRIGLLSLRT